MTESVKPFSKLYDLTQRAEKVGISDDDVLKEEVGLLRNNFMNNAQALLHGDLHSGSIFINENGIKIIDPEFAFYGPMGYDIGNVIGNLFFAWAYAEVQGTKNTKFIEWISSTIEKVLDLSMISIKVSSSFLALD